MVGFAREQIQGPIASFVSYERRAIRMSNSSGIVRLYPESAVKMADGE